LNEKTPQSQNQKHPLGGRDIKKRLQRTHPVRDRGRGDKTGKKARRERRKRNSRCLGTRHFRERTLGNKGVSAKEDRGEGKGRKGAKLPSTLRHVTRCKT